MTPDEDLTAPEITDAQELLGALEAILMVADVPVPLVNLATALEQPVNVIRDAVLALKADYDGDNGGKVRGFELREIGGGWRIFVRAEYDWAVKLLCRR